MEDGDAAEVGLMGHEGFTGLLVLLGADSGDLEAMVQAPGTALQTGATALREQLDRLPALHTLLHRYALANHGQVARSAACRGAPQNGGRNCRKLDGPGRSRPDPVVPHAAANLKRTERPEKP